MFSIDFKVNTRDLEKSLSGLESFLQNKAIARAVNRTTDMAKTTAVREIRDQGYNLKASVIKQHMRVYRANNKTLEALIVVEGSPIALVQYGARQVGKGVSVQVKNGRKIIPGAFIAAMESGHRGVFVRVGKARLPIRELFGPSIPQAIANAEVQKALAWAIKTHYPRILRHEISFILSKGK